MSLRLPSLRERRGDILPLARRAVQSCARGGQAAVVLSPAAEHALLEHDWPGNARELTNIVQRAAWLACGGRIDAADLELMVKQGSAAPAEDAGLDQDLKKRERELILATLRVTGGSRKLAAERLGISPRTLRHKLQQLKAAGVAVPRLADEEFVAASA
jgi:two-component system response regulator FlrC